MEVDRRVSYLGYRRATGALGTNAGAPYGAGKWVVTFDPAVFAISTGDFEVYHIALTGPTGSAFQVFVDQTFYDVASNGDINSWDPNQTLHMSGGQTLYFYWNSSATPPPVVTLWLRQPDLLNSLG